MERLAGGGENTGRHGAKEGGGEVELVAPTW